MVMASKATNTRADMSDKTRPEALFRADPAEDLSLHQRCGERSVDLRRMAVWRTRRPACPVGCAEPSITCVASQGFLRTLAVTSTATLRAVVRQIKAAATSKGKRHSQSEPEEVS